jgi:threonine/homoserine/homoserine lactone efflux protein
MKNLRPFAWVIIALNIYFVVAFSLEIDSTDSDTALGLQFMVLMVWLAIMNVVLYVLYRITGGKKRQCPACGKNVKKGLTICPSCNFDFMKAAGN